ncbi:hypothetical protein QOZ80_3BG0265270 [Eleusine coracana subsp. coracana]|nr:hypothetical protein QOZ80_3BG0265270 [Eleusine coracana subsp. coracana]
MAMNSPFDCVLVDLDDTLYPGDTGIGLALKRNIDEFLVAKLGVTAERAAAMRVELFRTYGSSLAGLIALGYDVHPDEYHSYVHGRLPYDRIAADPQLARTLQSIPQRKVLFTNSDRAHMERALERLGIDVAVFDDVVCFETMNPHLFGEAREEARLNGSGEHPVVVLKPSVDAIVAGIRAAGTNPRRTLFLDDSERNIAAGKALGLRTALVGKRVRSKDADYAMESIGSLRRVIPEIWGAVEQPELGMEKKGMRSDLAPIIQPPTVQA